LKLIALRQGIPVTKEMFLNHLYGGLDEPEVKIIDVFICKLRRKLRSAAQGGNYIETVWARGYLLAIQIIQSSGFLLERLPPRPVSKIDLRSARSISATSRNS
jgi:DNA-binding winged helix-turn-helix (wHTH) protein